MLDPARFIGIPFRDGGRGRDGLDCWGLVRLALADMGVTVPAYGEVRDETAIRDAVAAERDGWLEVPVSEARPGDVLLVRMPGHSWHVALVAGGGDMLHADRVSGVLLERYGLQPWCRRIAGCYRHPDLAQPQGDACRRLGAAPG